MANMINWGAGWTNRAAVISTELNSLAAGAWALGATEVDNSLNLDIYGKLEALVEYASAPATGGALYAYMITAPDGTNYESGNASEWPGNHKCIALMEVLSSADQKRYTSGPFVMEPAKTKFLLKNGGSTALEATGNILTLFTANEEVQ